MRKRFIVLLAALCLLLSLTACGGGKDMAASADMPADANYAMSADTAPMAPAGWEGAVYEVSQGEAPAPEAETKAEEGGGGLPANTKMIYTADMELETKEFDQASSALSDIVEELGGWFESRSLNQGGSWRSLSCTVRVPAEHFQSFLDRAGEAAHVVCKSDYSQDVSEAYYDSESRLATQRTKLERLQALLAQAAGMEDIIALESAISDTELQIEQLTGSLRKYDSLIGYSTVNIYLQEVYRLSSDEEIPVTFGQRFSAALSTGLQRGIDGVEDFVIAVARNWMGLLILAAVIAAAALLLRRLLRKRAAPPPPPPPPDPPAEKKEK